MKIFKLLLKEIKQLDDWGMEENVKLGEVAFDFKGKTDDTEFDLKKGDKLYYQHGTECKMDGEEYILVSLTNLICQKF